MKKILLLLTLFCALFVSSPASAVEVTIGDSQALTDGSAYIPWHSYYKYGLTQQIYTAAEIGMAGTINSITLQLYAASTPLQAYTVEIYMVELSDKASFESTSDWVALSASDLVYSGSVDFTSLGTTAGDVTFALNDAFTYSGTGNLLIAFRNQTGSYKTGLRGVVFSGTDNKTHYAQQDGSEYAIAAPGTAGTLTTSRNVITLDITPSGSVVVCDKPETLDITEISANSAVLNFSGGSGIYNVEYKAAGDADWTFATKNTTLTSYLLNELIPNTSYQVRIQSVCGENTSAYKSASFKTLIGLPYAESLATQGDWKKRTGLWDPDNGVTLTTGGSWGFGDRNGVLGGNHAYRNVFGTGCKDWIISPAIPLPADADLQLSFELALTDYNNADAIESFTAQQDDKFIVFVTTDANAEESATWTPLQQWDNAGSPYIYNMIATEGEEVAIDLSAYAGQTIQIAFYCESTATGGDNDIHVGNVLVDYTPTCLKPTLLHEVDGAATKNSLTLGWTANSGETAWRLQYKLPEDTDWNTVEANSNPFTITGLQPFTVYEVRVAAVCSETDFTDYGKVLSAKTAAGVPYAEDFNVSTLPSEWKRYSGKLSSVQSGGELSATTGGWDVLAKATANNVFDSAYHAVLNIAGANCKYWLVSPSIEMEAGYQLTFDLALTKSEGGAVTPGGQPDDVFAVLVHDGTEWTALREWSATSGYKFDEINGSANGQGIKIDLSAYANQNIRIAFYGESTEANGNNNLHIANVLVDLIPACSPALSLNITDLSHNSATAQWTTDEEGSAWQYGFVANPANDFVPAEEDFANNTTNLSAAMSGLNPETTYAFFLRKVCESGNSDVIVRTFTTFPTPKSIPWVEDFESMTANAIPAYWDNTASSSYAATTTKYYIWGVYSYSNNKMIRMYNSMVRAGTAVINTPRINLTPENGCMLTFDYTHAASCDALVVRISTNNGLNWTDLASFENNASNNGSNPGEFTRVELNLAEYTGQVVMLQFYAVADYSSGAIFVDNISVTELPDCLKPTGLSISEIQANSAMFSWDNEVAANWEYVCVPDSITDLPAFTPCTQNTVTVEGLHESTDYVFYLRRNCGEGVSDSIFVPFSTPCLPVELVDGKYTEDFEAYEGTTYAAAGVAPDCWSVAIGPGATVLPHVIGSGSYCYTHSGTKAFTFHGKGNNFAALPYLAEDLSALQISFWMETESASNGSLTLGYITAQDPGDFSTFQPIESYQNSKDIMVRREKMLNELSSDAHRLAFRWYYSGQYSCCIDDIEISYIPSCMRPEDVAVIDTTITVNSAAIDWLPAGLETNWLIQYKKSTDSVWSYVPDSVNARPFLISGLESSTVYDVRVAAWCDTNDSTAISEYAESIHIATLCEPYSIVARGAYTEDFEAYNGVAYNVAGVAPVCWDVDATGTVLPHVIGSGSYYYKHSGEKALTFYGSGYCYAALPEFAEPLNTLQLSFWMQTENAANGTLKLGYYTEAEPTVFHEFATYENHNGSMVLRETSLAALPDSAARLVFEWYYNTQYSCCIDDITIEEIPNCVKPENLAALDSLATPNSIVLTWDAQGSETAWSISYKPSADSVWAVVEALADTFELAGLIPSTYYDVKVAAICSATETSDYTLPITAATGCATVTQFPFSEDFDLVEANQMPLCWSRINVGTSTTYNKYPYVYNSAASAQSGTKSLRFYAYYSSTAGAVTDQYAILPEMEGISALRLRFNARKYSTSYNATFTVGVITDPADASTYVALDTITPSAATYEPFRVLFNAYEGGAKYIAIKMDAPASSYKGFYIDDIVIDSIPNCLEPDSLRAVLTKGHGSIATLKWAAGAASAWEVQYGMDAKFADAITANVTEPTLNLTGLISDSTYYARVKAICSETEESEWSNVISFTPMNAIIINDGTTTGSYVPFYGYYADMGTNSQFIIPEKEIATIQWDSITKLTFFASTTTATWEGAQFDVYVAETNDTVLSAMVVWTDMQKVVNSKHLELANKQMEVTLDKPFQYQGGNLLIGFKQTVTGTDVSCSWYGKSGVSGNSMYQYSSNSAVKSNFNPKVKIDHVHGEMPTCFVVKDLAVSGITASSAVISWTNGEEGQDAWQIVYSADPAFNPADATPIDVASNPYALSGLLTDTLYNVYVRANCGDEDGVSLWSTIAFRTAKSCQTPDELAAADITDVSASISWNTYGQTGFNLRYITGTDTVLVENVSSPYVITGLTGSTAYAVQVQAACAAEDSIWSEALNIKTACDIWSIATRGSYTEGFESYTGTTYSAAGVVPDCWATGGTSTYAAPHVVVSGGSYAYVHSGQNALNFCASANSYAYAIMPQFAEALSLLQISFWTKMESASAGTLYLGYITSDEDGLFHEITAFNNVTTMTKYEVMLDTVPAAATQLVFLWEYTGSSYYSCCIDDIEVEFIPTCLAPSAVAASEIAGHSAKISWTNGAEGQNAWQIAYNTAATSKPDTLSNIIDVTTNPFVLTGLDPETRYYIYVRANCGESDLSKWADGINFKTTVACPAPAGLEAVLTPGNGSIATLNWLAGDAAAWVIEYSLNADLSDSIAVEVSAPTINLTGLTPETIYYARVKANCGELDGESLYSAIISFKPTDAYELFINDGTATNAYVPVYGNYMEKATQRSQFIIPAAQLESLEWDSITTLTFYASQENVSWGAATLAAYVLEVEDEALAAEVDWDAMTQVMNETSLAVVGNQMVVAFDNAYQYQGGNLLIGIKSVQAGAYSNVYWYGVSATGASLGGYGDNLTQRNFLPKMLINYVPGVAPACPNPKNLEVSGITDSEATFTWKAVEGATWEYALVEGTATPETFAATTEATITLNELSEATDYTFYLRRACGADGYSDAMLSVSFTTAIHVEAVPFSENFEAPAAWKFVNGTEPNAWVIGNAASDGGEKALYISNDGGLTNSYTNDAVSASFATIVLDFTPGGTFNFAYDWKANGDYSVEDNELYDYLRVALVPVDAVLEAGTPALPEGYIALDNGGLYGTTAWTHQVADSIEVAEGLYKLVFAWFNDESDGDDTPAAVDNIQISRIGWATDIQSGAGIETKAVKFIHNNQVYIMINGAIYNVTGQKVELK